MPSDALVFSSIAQSNLPSEKKSAIRKWAESVIGPLGANKAHAHVRAGASAFRQGVEGVAIGGLLGIADASLKGGLDVTLAGKKVPVDIAGGAIATFLSVYMADTLDGLAPDLLNAGTHAMAVGAYRMSKQWKSGVKAHGEFGSEETDPILAIAESL